MIELSEIDKLFDEGFRFQFAQAVRLLERLYPERRPVGRDGDPKDEPVRFKVRPSLMFPASEIHQLTDGADGRPAQMLVEFMGLFGALGALPRHYTATILQRANFTHYDKRTNETRRVRDFTLREFLDLFNHRLISLHYRAYEKYRFYVGYEREEYLKRVSADDRRESVRRSSVPAGEYDRFTQILYDLVGMGTPGLRGRMDIPDQALCYYSGLVSQNPRSAVALEALLSDYFGVTVRPTQFRGQWLKLDEADRSRVGAANTELGRTLVAGSSVYDVQGGFRLRVGPMGFKRYEAFLPDGSAFRPLAQLARLFVGIEFSFDIQPVLAAPEVPECRLGNPRERTGARLGWTSWLKTRPFTRDADNAIFPVES